MKYKEALGRSILPVFGGLLLGGFLASLIFAIWLRALDSATLSEWMTTPLLAFGLLLFAALVAAPVTFLVGWPIYSLILSRGLAAYPSTLSIPLAIALIAWLLGEPELGALTALYGTCIAVITHALQVRSNNSFKPSPLRGLEPTGTASGGPA